VEGTGNVIPNHIQYNDTSGKSGLIQIFEFYTGVGDGAVSGSATLKAQVTQLLNSRLHQVTTMILDSADMNGWVFDDINHANYPVGTIPLVASQRDYVLPASEKILKLRRVDVTWDNSTYYRATPLSTGVLADGLGGDANTDANFTTAEPFYSQIGNAIWLYPRATAAQVTASAKLRIEFTREVDEFTTSDTTQEPGIDEPFHPMLAIGAALDWAVAKGLANKNDLAAMYADYETRLRRYYGRKNEDAPLQLRSVYDMDYGK